MKAVTKIVDGVPHRVEINKRRKVALTEHRCLVCEKVIENIGSGRKPSYCSNACKMKAYRKRLKESS